ncbi:MAG: hypothetical protein ABSG35_09625 [Syntrophobacteraceae bacterium]|jgi:hypothetical protein
MPTKKRIPVTVALTAFLFLSFPNISLAWHDETHLAIAKAAGYQKWYNAAGADIAKIKAGDKEGYNHYSNNPPDTLVTPKMVLDQVNRYNDPTDEDGHLYGAIIASLRDYRSAKAEGKYAEYHMAYCAHYVGDLSMPLHNTLFNEFNRQHHAAMDGIVEDEVLNHLERIKIYPIQIKSEDDLVREIARIANLSMKLGYRLEAENRMLTKEEAYIQLGHSASLLKAILDYTR